MTKDREKKQLLNATVFTFFFYFAQSVARNIYNTLTPFIVAHYGTSLTESSLFSMAENIGFIAIMLLVTLTGDKRDKGGILLGVCAAYGAVLLLMGRGPSMTVMLLCLFITGMLGRYVDTLCTAYISDLYGERRANYMSWLLVMFYVGSTLAPNLNTLLIETAGLPWYTSYTLSGILMTAGSVLFLVTLLTLGRPVTEADRVKEKKAAAGEKASVKDLFRSRNMRVLFWTYVIVSVSLYFNSQLTLYLSMEDPVLYDTATRGFIATAGSLGLVVGSLLYVWISRKMSASRYLAMEMMVTFVFSLLGILIDRPVPWMVFRFLSNAIGGGSFTARTLLCCEEFPDRSSSAIALVSLGTGIASILSTPLLNLLADMTSFRTAMFVSLFFGLFAWALIRFAYAPHAPAAEH